MNPAPPWQQHWHDDGVALTRRINGKTESRRLGLAELTAMNNYDASMLSLPHYMDATMVVTIEGRIDHPAFTVICRLEPSSHAHAWAVYRREGARLLVGERSFRLNPHQYALFDALEALQEAGADIAQRLRVWPALVATLHAPYHTRIIVQGLIPRVHIAQVPQLPPRSFTRIGTLLRPAGDALWAMLPRHRYFLKMA